MEFLCDFCPLLVVHNRDHRLILRFCVPLPKSSAKHERNPYVRVVVGIIDRNTFGVIVQTRVRDR